MLRRICLLAAVTTAVTAGIVLPAGVSGCSSEGESLFDEGAQDGAGDGPDPQLGEQWPVPLVLTASVGGDERPEREHHEQSSTVPDVKEHLRVDR